MQCGIKNCLSSDNHFLWACNGCHRTYHAACVGVQRNYEEFSRAFLVPMCADCQERFSDELNLKKLLLRQTSLTEDVAAQKEANHKIINQLKNMQPIHSALEHIESLLCELNDEMRKVKTSSATAGTLKTHIAALFEDLPTNATKTDVEQANAALANNLQNVIADGLNIIDEKINALQESIESVERCSTAETLIEEIQALSVSISNLNVLPATMPLSTQLSLAEELCDASARDELNKSKMTTEKQGPTPGWRIIGNKKIWKRDWREFDARQRTHRLHEKNADKDRRKRRQRNHNTSHIINKNRSSWNRNNNKNNSSNNNNINNNNNNNNNNNSSSSSNGRLTLNGICAFPAININNNSNHNAHEYDPVIHHNILPLDKDLLAAARIQFSGPPKQDVTSKFINFQKGETINPYRTERTVASEISNDKTNPVPMNQDSQFELDPMRPPIVRLTELSSQGDQRFLKARLRDPKIMRVVRLYLAYMKDQSPNVCVEGMTPTSIKMLLRTEGLPTSPVHLEQIFIETHQEYGMDPKEALNDLTSYRRFLASERTCHLQRIRESTAQFYSPNFRK